MAKLAKKNNTAGLMATLVSSLPWNCTHFGAESEIEAHIEATGKWQTIADVHPFMGFDGEDIASLIVSAVNSYDATQALLKKIRTTLETCQKCEALDTKIKQAIDEALQGIKQQERAWGD